MSEASAEVNKPLLSIDDAAGVFHRFYGRKPAFVKPLDGFCALNFFVRVNGRDGNHVDENMNDSQDSKIFNNFVLKIMNAEDSKEAIYFRTVHSVQKYLSQHGLKCVAPIQNILGDDLSMLNMDQFTTELTHKDDNETNQRLHGRFMVRVYPYMEGTILQNVLPADEIEIFYEAGKLLAEFHKSLESYPGDIGSLKEKPLTLSLASWSLSELLKYIDVMKDEKRKELILDVVRKFEDRVLQRKDVFRKANTYQLCGVIDFDIAEYNCLIFDVGISMMYMSLSKAAKTNPLKVSAAVLAGYQHVNPLTPTELEVLPRGFSTSARLQDLLNL
ncbi:hydroxylysine kinase-like [Amphiura filiformis]|uniref:hydroxylysine kinase-like n=1 Tax=Amphiura filiformis TaxID=82378 RepID=UPI003B2116DC